VESLESKLLRAVKLRSEVDIFGMGHVNGTLTETVGVNPTRDTMSSFLCVVPMKCLC